MYYLKKLMSYYNRYWNINITGLLISLAVILLSMASPYMTKIIVDDVLINRNFERLAPLAMTLLGITLIHALLRYIKLCIFEYTSQKVLYDLRSDLYDKLQAQSFQFYDKIRTGHMMNRMVGDLESIRNFLNSGYIVFLESIVTFAFTFTIVISMNAALTLLLLSTIPFLVLNTRAMARKLRPVYMTIRVAFERLTTAAQENITGIRVVKAFGREEYEKQKFYDAAKEYNDVNINAADIRSRYIPLSQAINGLGAVIVLFFGGWFVMRGSISIGELVAFNGYMFMLSNPINNINNIVNQWENAKASMEKVFDIIEQEPAIQNPENPVILENTEGDIKFENVNFRYNDNYVLKDICLSIKSGSTVAIMGKTGSGKTTLINLIERFYDCSKGRVIVDGVDVKDFDINNLRSHIGIIMQETFLFSDTIAANIAFAKPDAGMDEIERAARIADAHEFIIKMPDGYETVIGERGVGLSGGQKQRIAIARAILLNPKILILDDATSNLDMETEQEIQETLRKIMVDRTTIIIAHRISSVSEADEIIFLEDGKIVERGTHDTLIELKGRYYNTLIEQYREYAI